MLAPISASQSPDAMTGPVDEVGLRGGTDAEWEGHRVQASCADGNLQRKRIRTYKRCAAWNEQLSYFVLKEHQQNL